MSQAPVEDAKTDAVEFPNSLDTVDSNFIDSTLDKDCIYLLQQSSSQSVESMGATEVDCQPLGTRMYNLMIDTKMHDVFFEIGSHKLKYSSIRSILASVSQVFTKMLFSSKMKESINNDGILIQIPDISAIGFENCLLYAFQGGTYVALHKINGYNVLDTIKAADKYQIQGLLKICVRYINSSLTPENVVSKLVLGSKILSETFAVTGIEKGDKMLEKCMKFIQKHASTREKFEKMLKSLDFVKLPPALLCEVLKLDELNCDEERLFEACLQWYLSNSTKLDDRQLKSFIIHIRFNLMKPEYFLENVEKSGLLNASQVCSVYRQWMLPNAVTCLFNCKRRSVVVWNDIYRK